ncbi:V-type proton ATPase catalytic subunit A-like [Asparagus officinalis]|uniref:V-type proton ATPase catalytic subunit A-like n=1 Tax=Asparagus officinalis TaxID=4686 RepID=UPI00098E6F22|nr:V-type proton ATPase catalytic subunit A-like [Asparagus officinalis]
MSSLALLTLLSQSRSVTEILKAQYLFRNSEFIPKIFRYWAFRKPLSVELGPGILGNVFDGIQRPLKTIAIRSGDVYIPRGVSVPALDKDALWEFEPKKLAVGDLLTGGDLYATVFENTLMQHHVALPPGSMGKISHIAPAGQYSLQVSNEINSGSMGKISHIAPAGQYSLQDTVLELEFQGINKNFTMLQTWHVRTPRPVATKLAADTPLLTGQIWVVEKEVVTRVSLMLHSMSVSFHQCRESILLRSTMT